MTGMVYFSSGHSSPAAEAYGVPNNLSHRSLFHHFFSSTKVFSLSSISIFYFFSYYIQHCFICRLSDSTVPTDAGIELRTVTTGA
jgi:hypothetical protein